MEKRFDPVSFTVLNLLKIGGVMGLVVAAPGASAKVWILAGALWFVTGLGVTVGYHRMETHGGFKTYAFVKWVLFFLGAMTLQGKVRGWVLTHRAHHKYQDQPGLDPHSPREYKNRLKGLAWAHEGWLWYKYKPPSDQSSVKLDQDGAVMWFERYYFVPVVTSFLLPLLVAGWNGLWIAGLVRIVFGLNITWGVNSVCHWIGTKAKDSAGNVDEDPLLVDDSRNNWLWAFLSWGEGWHANHHRWPTWAYHGWHWWQIDTSKWCIRSMELLHLAWKVKKPHQYYNKPAMQPA